MKRIPDLISKLGHGFLVVDVDSVFRARFKENANLVSFASEHDNTLNERRRCNNTLHWSRNRLLSGRKNDDVIGPSNTVIKNKIMNTNFGGE